MEGEERVARQVRVGAEDGWVMVEGGEGLGESAAAEGLPSPFLGGYCFPSTSTLGVQVHHWLCGMSSITIGM